MQRLSKERQEGKRGEKHEWCGHRLRWEGKMREMERKQLGAPEENKGQTEARDPEDASQVSLASTQGSSSWLQF